ncbi:hypothetical protein [Geopsychrobacter electrodiphilus]|uniref:hypothetical protein n=1 Tax=Geopsychrobacter electrodiphilus TaxID=225196 RepID=UPI00037FD268|nr:hypothetical protein [Geopsychrobacter electrodiphilus]
MKINYGMGPLLWLSTLILLCSPLTVSAAELSIHSDTLFRAFSRDTTTKNNAAVMPTYEYLQVDMGNPEAKGLSFHLYGWGRADLADNGYYTDNTAGELLYGYAEYNGEQAHFNARLGRQYIFEGVANESIDGLRLSSDLGKYFSGSTYAGQQVALASENGRSGDSIYGGRLVNHMAGLYDLGVSYKKIRNDSADATELTGLDLAAYLPFGVNFHGLSKYNLLSDAWAEHSYELSAKVGPVSIRPYFQQFQYEDYFGTGVNSANPFRFLAASGEQLSINGLDLTLPLGETWVFVAKAKNYDYKVLNDNSQYYSGQATWSDDSQDQIGGEIGTMVGDIAQNKYYLLRLFTYWAQLPAALPVSFISSDLVYVGYDKPIYGEDSSLFISLGTGKKFMHDALELKLSADYNNDPYFDQDLRGMLTASYSFGKSL